MQTSRITLAVLAVASIVLSVPAQAGQPGSHAVHLDVAAIPAYPIDHGAGRHQRQANGQRVASSRAPRPAPAATQASPRPSLGERTLTGYADQPAVVRTRREAGSFGLVTVPTAAGIAITCSVAFASEAAALIADAVAGGMKFRRINCYSRAGSHVANSNHRDGNAFDSYPSIPAHLVRQHGLAAIVASDRMITSGDVQYEPQQLKIAFITDHTLLLIAGEYSIHSEAIKETQKQVRRDTKFKPQNIAKIYGKEIQKIRQRHAEDIYLAPLGMNTDTFLAQQKDLSEHFIASITDQIQNYEGTDVEAIVVGGDDGEATIYAIDTIGRVRCYDDVGFAAIGIGAEHARSQLMQGGYVRTSIFASALAMVFAAKKAAQIAPGVGDTTDLYLVFKDRIERLRTDVHSKLRELYKEYAFIYLTKEGYKS